jgi:hypothetical protein
MEHKEVSEGGHPREGCIQPASQCLEEQQNGDRMDEAGRWAGAPGH